MLPTSHRFTGDATTTTLTPSRPAPHPGAGHVERRPLPPPATTEWRPPSHHLAKGIGALILLGGFAFFALAVLAFSAGWADGDLLLDGPGIALHVGLAYDNWQGGGVPYWMQEIWSGTPFWALAPSFPIFILFPLVSLLGPEGAVKTAAVIAQIAGGCGAFVLARSLWSKRNFTPLLAGLLYALHPTFISHTALFGHETSAWVMAATPWLAWSFRHTLRGAGAGYIALSGFLVGFSVLQQGEHAYGLVVLCACMMAVELARARLAGPGPSSAGAVILRTGVAALFCLGFIAYWLFPFTSLSKSFVLTPPDSVRTELVSGIGGSLGRHPEALVTRSPGLDGTVDFSGLTGSFEKLNGLMTGSFYLGWVCMALTVVTIVLLSRRHHEPHLSAILFAGLIGLWLSTGGVPLASSGLARGGAVVPFAVVGVLAGALVGGFLRQLHLGRMAVVIGATLAVLLVALPYAAPFLTLQHIVPLLDSIRFPRFYPLAMLGLALGAAYPLTLVQTWSTARRPDLAPWLTAALSLVVAGAFLVDVYPYRSYYRLRRPATTAEYRDSYRVLGEGSDQYRLASVSFGDPSKVASILAAGRSLSVGWPHPVAAKQIWTLTGKALVGPPHGYRNAALALSSTEAIVEEKTDEPAKNTVVLDRVQIEPIPQVLPMVRAYERAVVVADDDLAPGLAAAFAPRHIGVVTGAREAVQALGKTPATAVQGDRPCQAESISAADAGGPEMAGEVAAACALGDWVNTNTKGRITAADQRPGAIFDAGAAGLKGVSILFDREPARAELVLREVAGDGRSLGREIARARASGADANNMAAFVFDPIPDSAGKRYAFELSCTGCPGNRIPKMAHFETSTGGNLIIGGRLDRKRLAAFSLVYDRVAPAPPSGTVLSAFREGPGRWSISADGPEPALVVVADAWFPGWQARVDGRRVPVLKADGAFLGVAVEAGRHRITLEYTRPAATGLGRVVTVVTVLASGIFFVLPPVSRRLRRNRRPAAMSHS